LYPLDTAILDYPALIVSDQDEAAIRYGQQVSGPAPTSPEHDLARAYSEDGRFIGLIRWDLLTKRWQPDRVFPKPA
jgi:tRNA U55 pseudouridine synthase TruB